MLRETLRLRLPQSANTVDVVESGSEENVVDEAIVLDAEIVLGAENVLADRCRGSLLERWGMQSFGRQSSSPERVGMDIDASSGVRMQPKETGADVENVVEGDVVIATPGAECSAQVRAGVSTPPRHVDEATKLDADACSASCQSECLTVAADSARPQPRLSSCRR